MSSIPKVNGRVTEEMTNGQFRVVLDTGREIICYLAGKMRHNRIRVILADEVEVELDKYGGKGTNRIVRRR